MNKDTVAVILLGTLLSPIMGMMGLVFWDMSETCGYTTFSSILGKFFAVCVFVGGAAIFAAAIFALCGM